MLRNFNWVRRLVLVLVLLLVPGLSLTTAAPFIPSQATVVLLSGLPGDVESESTYHEQLQTWLEILAANGQAQKVFVLCDDPETVRITPSPGTNPAPVIAALHADRTNFLGLETRLGTNPLVVIAWGHGGRQGSEPVFHVRGPRITAADFNALAAKVPAGESRWILQFRGSGACAGLLAGENRQILASESDTTFTSDPIGMAVIGKIARAKPAISFEDLAEQFGRGTAAWYTERNLARTEEPTLWQGKNKPRLLAPASEEHTLASVTPEASEKSAKDPEKPASPEPLPGDLPSAWQDLKRVDARKYPDADAVMLRRRLIYTLGANPALASDQDEFIQILTAEGKRFGDFDISFSPPFEDITFLDCEVLSPAGKLSRLDPEAIRESRDESIGDYQAGRRKFFSLPGVVPGAMLHVRYRNQWKTFPMPHVSLTIPIALELPALDAAIEVNVPKDSPFHFAVDLSAISHLPAPISDPAIKQSTYATTYAWRFENLPASEHEILAPPRSHSELLISTFPDWTAFSEWYTRISKLTDEVTPEIAARATDLTKTAKNDREKVLALFNYVTRLRYVAVPMGVNSFRPHAAANVLQNQFGDCKDKANLLNALLHSLKIDAHLVLVPRFSQARDDIPGLSFNHAISRVSLGSETLWVDTTDDVCRFGMLPPGDPGRKVLVIDGQTTNLTQLPVPEPQQHPLELRGTLDCSNPLDALPATLTATAQGYPDYELREAAREVKGHRSSVPLLAVRFHPGIGSFALEKQTSSSVSALDENFSWQAEGAFIGLCSPLPPIQQSTNLTAQHSDTPPLHHSDSFSLRAPFWVPKEWDLALHHRQGILFLNQGYPLTLNEDFEFTLAAKSDPVVLPGVTENKTAPLRWRIEWAKVGDAKLAAHLRLELVRGELSAEETSAFQEQLRALLAAMARGATISTLP